MNLRSGPSDGTTVRSTVERGDELIELRRERGWLGVRVARTGEEGWVFQDLVQRVARTQLGAPMVDAGFQELSPPFNQLISGLGEELGYAVIDKVEVKPLADCSPRELEKDNPEIRRTEEMAVFLGQLYNREVTEEDTVTVIHFSEIQ